MVESFIIASHFTFSNTLFNKKYVVWNISRFSNFLKTQEHTKCYTTVFACDDYSNGSLFTPALNSHLSILPRLTNIYTLCKPDVGNWCKKCDQTVLSTALYVRKGRLKQWNIGTAQPAVEVNCWLILSAAPKTIKLLI